MKIERLIGYEDEYMIDELGNIVCLPKADKRHRNQYSNYYVIKGKVDPHGYVRVILTKDGIAKSYLVHRLVAQQFIPNPDNLPQVNHINGNKCDNTVSNLEWCTAKQNVKHAIDNNLSDRKRKMLAALEKVNSVKAYRNIQATNGETTMMFADTNAASAYFQCHKDKVSQAIRHGKLFHGYRLTCERPHLANEET